MACRNEFEGLSSQEWLAAGDYLGVAGVEAKVMRACVNSEEV